jgi:Protein of unknown function (DUF4245)
VTDVPASTGAETDADADAATPAGSGPPGRAGRTAKDMAISLIVLLIPVAIIAAFVWARGGDDPVTVDPQPAIAEAQAAKAFPVLEPNGLSTNWHAVSAVYTTADRTLRIGYVTPGGGGVQLIESSSATDGLLINELGDDVRPNGVATVGATTWNGYLLHNGQRAIVLPTTGRTVIIMGNADQVELQELAGTLR